MPKHNVRVEGNQLSFVFALVCPLVYFVVCVRLFVVVSWGFQTVVEGAAWVLFVLASWRTKL